jgi:hypothetical protein
LNLPRIDPNRFLLKLLHRKHGLRAVDEETRNAALPARAAEAAVAAALENLAGSSPIPIGTTDSGTVLSVDSSTVIASGLVVGATGAGKSRFLIGLVLQLLERFGGPGVEIELVDPKFETYDLLRLALAALWLQTSLSKRGELASRIRVIDWARDWITPSAPFERIGTEVSDAYLARLRADVVAQASPHAYTDAMRHGYFMLGRLLIEKQFPMNVRFTTKLFRDESFRKRIAAGIADQDVREYFLDLDRNLPKQTSEGLLRRLQEDFSFPEIRYSEGIPPAALRKLLPKEHPSIVIGNYSSRMSLPQSKAIERANHRIVDVLLKAPRRNQHRPGLLLLEESPVLLSRSKELIEPLTTATRTLRSVGMGIVHLAQDFSNALPADLVRTLVLNARWLAMFRVREDAELIYPHVLDESKGIPEAARRRTFAKTMESLPQRRFYFHAKGYPALPASSLTVPDFVHAAGVSSEDELREIFNREIASRWVVPTRLAAQLIAEWEAEVIDRADVPPSAPGGAGKRSPHQTLADLLNDLGKDKEDPE